MRKTGSENAPYSLPFTTYRTSDANFEKTSVNRQGPEIHLADLQITNYNLHLNRLALQFLENRQKITVAMLELAGHFVPLVTPFTDDGATIGEVRLARLLRFYLELGVDGFAVATDIGEFATLTLAERKQLVELVQRESHGVKPLTVNVSSLSTSQSLDLAQHAARHGARAVTLIPPYYGSFSQSEIIDHVRVIAGHSSLPILVIDPAEQLLEEAKSAIAHHPNVHLAWPQTDQHEMHTDWFRCYGLSVEPMNGVSGSKASDFMLRNRAAVTKSLLLDQELEVGPPRMPVQPIPLREIRRAA